MKINFTLILLFALIALKTAGQKLGHVEGEVIVQLKPGADINRLVEDFSILGINKTGLKVSKYLSPPMRIWLLAFDVNCIEESLLLQEISKHAGVQIAQFNRFIQMRSTVPNDPNFMNQWQWKNTGQNGGTPDADVDAEEAWDITTGGLTATGKEIVVCVIERGANRQHEDLQGNLWFNQSEIPGNSIDDDGNGYIDDYNGWNPVNGNDNIPNDNHGTFVSGMIGAKGNNGIQVTGVNWDVKIMHVVIGSLTESNVIEAYTYPLVMRRKFNETGGEQGALIVSTNASWGLDGANPADFPLWCSFYDSLGQAGILNCGATANINWDIDLNGDMPTGCSSEFLLSVTSTNRNDQRASAGYGLTTIDIAAPGESVVNVVPPGTWSGTSFASPVIAGLVALLYSAPCPFWGEQAIEDPAGAARLVRDAIFGGVDRKPSLINEIKYGGRANAFQSLNILLNNCGPCPIPYGISLQNIIDTTASLSWISTDSTLYTQLRWRKNGEQSWTENNQAVSPFAFPPLTACTDYEFQLEEVCLDTTSGPSEIFAFKTDGCCEPPSKLHVSNITATSVAVKWDKVLAANSYNLLFKTPNGDEITQVIEDTLLELDELPPCSVFGIQIQTVCDTGFTEFSESVSFRTLGCGPCLDLSYCSSKSNNANQEWIKNVSIGNLNHTSGSDGGYGDFTGIETFLTTYSYYTIHLTPGFEGGTFSEWFRVWMDFNHDGDFTDAGELVFNATSATTATVTGRVVVPGTAMTGTTRMRVAMRWNQSPNPCDPVFNYGEVEDYCITILEGTPPDCLFPDSLTLSEINFETATVNWHGSHDALIYELRYKKASDTIWTVHQSPTLYFQLQNLTNCTEYAVQVRSDCIGVTGEWSDSLVFTTNCRPPCNEIPTGLDISGVTASSAILKWDVMPMAVGYSVRYKKTGTNGWVYLTTDGNFYQLLGLESCADYQFSLKTLCEGNLSSDFSLAFDFNTECVSSVSGGHHIEDFKIWPNPFSNSIQMDFYLNKPSKVVLEIFDVMGKVKAYETKQLPAGAHHWPWPNVNDVAPNLVKGIFFIKLTSDGGYVSKKIIKG